MKPRYETREIGILFDEFATVEVFPTYGAALAQSEKERGRRTAQKAYRNWDARKNRWAEDGAEFHTLREDAEAEKDSLE